MLVDAAGKGFQVTPYDDWFMRGVVVIVLTVLFFWFCSEIKKRNRKDDESNKKFDDLLKKLQTLSADLSEMRHTLVAVDREVGDLKDQEPTSPDATLTNIKRLEQQMIKVAAQLSDAREKLSGLERDVYNRLAKADDEVRARLDSVAESMANLRLVLEGHKGAFIPRTECQTTINQMQQSMDSVKTTLGKLEIAVVKLESTLQNILQRNRHGN
jgi:chromosome segregation ATPase